MRGRAGGIGYMVKRPDGVLASTRGVWASKESARRAFVKSLGRGWTWRRCYARGCRIVVVDLKELG
jgi:hypothetical protein